MELKTIGVIGSGQMGMGIAIVSAMAGLQVVVHDASAQSLDKGFTFASQYFSRLVAKGTLRDDLARDYQAQIRRANSLEDFSHVDFAIEAIVEHLESKRQLLQALDSILPQHAVIASNTSSISITKLASCTSRPPQVIGMHFMNPVPVMKLVEVIRGLQTDDATFVATEGLAARMGKTTVLGIDRPGFIVNRILVPMVNEAIFLLAEGVKSEDIDAAMKLGTNQPMGPLELADFVGLDTLLYILQVLHQELGEDKYRPAPLLVKYVEAGWLGKKTGRGFYTYQA